MLPETLPAVTNIEHFLDPDTRHKLQILEKKCVNDVGPDGYFEELDALIEAAVIQDSVNGISVERGSDCGGEGSPCQPWSRENHNSTGKNDKRVKLAP